jgi:RNA polymerase sigma factor (sigma-70 family)
MRNWRGMVETPDASGKGARALSSEAIMVASEVDAWFGREVLPLESALMQFLQHNWRNQSDICDFRQEVYVRVYEAALKKIPDRPKQFVFATARNFLLDRVRQEQVIPIEAGADLEALEVAADTPSPDQIVMARDELRRLQAALDRLPPRCREAIVLGRIEGLSGRAIAERMGIAEGTVSEYLSNGICALVEILYGEPPNVRRKV